MGFRDKARVNLSSPEKEKTRKLARIKVEPLLLALRPRNVEGNRLFDGSTMLLEISRPTSLINNNIHLRNNIYIYISIVCLSRRNRFAGERHHCACATTTTMPRSMSSSSSQLSLIFGTRFTRELRPDGRYVAGGRRSDLLRAIPRTRRGRISARCPEAAAAESPTRSSSWSLGGRCSRPRSPRWSTVSAVPQELLGKQHKQTRPVYKTDSCYELA